MLSTPTRMHSKASGHFSALGFCSIKQEMGNLKSIYKGKGRLETTIKKGIKITP